MLSINGNRESGFLLPLTIFIILGVGLLAVSTSRFLTISSHGYLLQGLSSKSFRVAEAGLDFAILELLNVSDIGLVISPTHAPLSNVAKFPQLSTEQRNKAAVLASGDLCRAVETFPDYSTIGIDSCDLSITCQCIEGCDSTSGTGEYHYQLRSTARCGSKASFGERSVEVTLGIIADTPSSTESLLVFKWQVLFWREVD